MNSNLEQLIGLLKQEIGLYRSLLIVIDEEKEAVVRSDLEAFKQTGADKDSILSEIQKEEDKRRQVVADLAQKLGYAAPEVTLTKISQRVAEPHAGNLRRVSQEILAVLSQVQAANLRNKQILEHSLALLNGAFNRLNELAAPNTVYYRTGNIQTGKSAGKCVCSDI